MTKEFDVIIFGASGFTGQFVVEEMAKNASKENIKWAVAGRNLKKVQQTLIDAQKSVSDNLKHIKIFETDVTHEISVEHMCKNARLVINCVGPYEKFGEQVVRACVKHKTHIIDMTIELMFINRMMLKYHEEAKARGIYIVSACGIGYLFWEMMVPAMQQSFEGGVHSVDIHIEPVLKSRSVHFATWESIVNMSNGFNDILTARQKVYSQLMKQNRSKWSIISPSFPFKYSKQVKGLISVQAPAILFTSDLGEDMKADVFGEKPIKVDFYCAIDSLFILVVLGILLFFIMTAMMFSVGRRLLTKYPEVFSLGIVTKDTLSEDEKESATGNFTGIATGWSKKQLNSKQIGKPDKTVVFRGSGPPAYRTTAICLVQAALIVLKETDRLPKRGGIYLPLTAFSRTSLSSRLQKHGIMYKEEKQP